MQKRTCDLCNTPSANIVHHFDNWFLLECNECGLRWGTGEIKINGNLYNKNYFNSDNSSIIGYSNYDQEKKLRELTFNSWFKKIEKILKPGYNLDVGCAYGYSVKIAKERGWDSFGIDISEHATGIAKKENLNIQCEDFLKFKPQKKFDLITAWDVLEHSISPMQFFKKAKSFLNHEGLLAITTPVFDSKFVKYHGKNWFEYKWPEHLFYFSRDTLNQYSEQLKMEVVCLQYAIKFKTLTNAFFRLIGKYETNPGGILKNVIIPYSSFSEAFIILRKR